MAPRKRGRPRSKSAPTVLHTPTKNKKRKQWSNESMTDALEEVERGMPVKRAARLFGVPRSTLRDRVAGNVKHGTNPGPTLYLTKCEETELASFLVDVAKAGYGKSRGEIKQIAENVARTRRF